MKDTDIGILLHRTAFSESSWITTFYTQNAGVQQFVFQGAKRKQYNLYPLNVSELTFYRRADSEMSKLTKMEHYFIGKTTFSDPRKQIISFFIADVVRKSVKTNEREPQLFSFLHQTIVAMDKTDNLAHFPLHFLADFTTYIGIQPNTNEKQQPNYFDIQQGEFSSDLLSHPTKGMYVENGTIVSFLFELFQKKTQNFTAPLTIRKELLDVLLRYYATHIPHFNVNKSLFVIRELLF